MELSDFYYDLPKALIAQTPLADRASSRLMKMNRASGELSHMRFCDITGLLREGDCLVLNETKVIPARLYGRKEGSGAPVEILLLKRLEGGLWEALARPGKKLRPGDRVVFGNGELSAEIIGTDAEGDKTIRLIYDGILEELLDRLGEMPLPPYITEELADQGRYQTVYAAREGSAAAPTAGLHFTNELLARIGERGVKLAKVTLHVGLGTFRPVKAESVEEHHMHSEYYEIDNESCALINSARKNGGCVVAVGTTSCRALETVSDEEGYVWPSSGNTDIFIYPGYRFKCVDALITNFHLPESTLIMLVSAFCSREMTLAAYREAVKERYRFFSFGDAMIIL